MLRARQAIDRALAKAPGRSGEDDQPRQSPELRPGPVRGTSWKEVQAVDQASDAPTQSLGQPSSSAEGDGEEEIRFKDLDTGKVFSIPKKHTITDLSSGQLFALCNDDSFENGIPKGDSAGQNFKDFTSGKELTPDEMDVALGLRPDPQAIQRQREQEQAASAAASKKLEADDVLSKSKKWLKKVTFTSKKSATTEYESDSEASPGSTPKVEDASSHVSRLSASSSTGCIPVRVGVHKKYPKDLSDLYLMQCLPAHQGIVWAMKFSHNGCYLATAGQDGLVHVWEVLAPQGDAQPSEPTDQSASSPSTPQANGSPTASEGSQAVFKSKPHRIYRGHKQDVLDVSWSKTLFVLSASMDKTVRLWHVSLDQCLRVFRHTDFVTAVDFHPIDDKHFVSGSIDCKVRIWNIPDKSGRVVDYADVHEMVTAVVFSSDGSRAIVGTMKGKCQFYQCSSDFKLEYLAQIDVKNRRGKASRGRKITGIQFLPNDPTKLLITSNDSRIRLYDNYSLLRKYKGLHNSNTQIRAAFSENGEFVMCGSDDGAVYFWRTATASSRDSANPQSGSGQAEAEKNGAYEWFQAHSEIATVAVFAPSNLRYADKRSVGADEMSDYRRSASGNHRSMAVGVILLTAGYDGVIKVFENGPQRS